MTALTPPIRKSAQARQRLLDQGGPLFNNAWREVVFIHYEVDPIALQPLIPFELDLCAGRAYVSLVAFTLSELHPYRPSTFWRFALAPMRTLAFLNLRTYVRHGAEPGVYFLAEWLPSRWPVLCGRQTFGLPYRFGRLAFSPLKEGITTGRISEGRVGPTLAFTAHVDAARPAIGLDQSLDDFLVERYIAFTQLRSTRRMFRIWHQPWPLIPIGVEILRDDLLAGTGPWFETAKLSHAAYSPGLPEVWIGRPERIA